MSVTERIANVLTWMEATNTDLAIVTSPANVMYLSGFYNQPHERFMGAVISRLAEPFLLVPSLDREKAVDKGSLAVHTHADVDRPLAILKGLLPNSSKKIRSIGIEKHHLLVARLEEIQEQFPHASFVNVEDRLNVMRLQKDAQEVENMRRAAKLADELVAFAVSQELRGRREYEVVQAIESYAKQHGAERMSFETMVLAGEKSALPHGVPAVREIRTGDLVLFDLGVVLDGYCSDITRTFVVGEASAQQRQIYETVLQANLAAIQAVRPGVTAAEIDRAARDVIATAGFGEFFTHRVGHGLGIDIHESPSMHGKNQQVLLPGMMFTIEPGIYLPGVGGVRIEDDVLVTEAGVEVLTAYPKELRIV